jgi:hypothetical protein
MYATTEKENINNMVIIIIYNIYYFISTEAMTVTNFKNQETNIIQTHSRAQLLKNNNNLVEWKHTTMKRKSKIYQRQSQF